MDPVSLLNYQYTNPQVIRQYSTVGFHPAEEKLIGRYFKPGTSVLDIGCGAGRTSIPLAQRGYQVVAIDLMPTMIAAARQQARTHGIPLDFRVMDAAHLSFPKQSFRNVLFSYNGFEQIPGKKNRKQALQKMFDVLESGGCLILTTRSGLAPGRRSLGWALITITYPYHYFFRTAQKRVEFGDKFWGGLYCHYFNPFSLKKSAQAIGFRLVAFNSEQNIVKDRPANLLTHFSGARVLYYVFTK